MGSCEMVPGAQLNWLLILLQVGSKKLQQLPLKELLWSQLNLTHNHLSSFFDQTEEETQPKSIMQFILQVLLKCKVVFVKT